MNLFLYELDFRPDERCGEDGGRLRDLDLQSPGVDPLHHPEAERPQLPELPGRGPEGTEQI